ncbi:phosphate ABC transporter substrate-binding protein [Ideonella sp. DXS29W]|uniref:Phosphate ABC transporter substrate-binding protein n=1 Tax=Ideonella lacteola TaxID=2984193 RepID=A0ABU9BRM3_9BURK
MTDSLLSTTRRHLFVVAASLAVAFSAHGGERKLVLTGASTVAPLAAEIGKRFEKLNPGVQVDVQTGGSARGVNDARVGLSDIGMVSRDLKPDEEQQLKSFTIAYDGVCMIVHKSNPVSTLTKEQVVGIYTGRITNWKELGGLDRKITVVNKAEGRSTLELFLHHFGLVNSQIKAHVVVGDNEQDIKTVVGNPGAVAYVSIGTGEFDVEQGMPLKLLPMEGIAATSENVKNRSFPLMRVLNLVTKGQPTGLSKQFIDYARTESVHDLVKDQYFVPLASAR